MDGSVKEFRMFAVNMRQDGNCEDNEARATGCEQSGKSRRFTKETNSIHFMYTTVPNINLLSHVCSKIVK